MSDDNCKDNCGDVNKIDVETKVNMGWGSKLLHFIIRLVKSLIAK